MKTRTHSQTRTHIKVTTAECDILKVVIITRQNNTVTVWL